MTRKPTSQFSNLSKEQKIIQLELMREKKRRSKLKKDTFKPHAEQEAFMKHDAWNKFNFCGNGWGKTCVASNLGIYHADGFNPITGEYYKVPSTVHIILDHPSKVRETWLPEMRKWFNIEDEDCFKNGKPFINEIRRRNGSRIVFMFHEQPEMVYESTEFKTIIMDEPPPRHIFIAIKRGQRTKGHEPKLYCLGTPIYQPWLREEIYERWLKEELPNTQCFFGSSEANRDNLRDGFIEEFGQYLTEDEKKVRLHGQFFSSAALALRHLWEDETHIIDEEEFYNSIWRKEYPVVIAIDPHPSKAHHAVILGADKFGRLYYIKEMERKLVAREFARELVQFYSGFRVVDIIVDSLGSAEGTGNDDFKSFIQVLKENGVPCRATSFKDKSDEAFIEKIRTSLAIPSEPDNFGFYVPQLRVVAGNNGIIKNIKNVGWQLDRATKMNKPKLDISKMDYLACLKYGLATGVSHRHAPQKPRNYGGSKASKTLYGFKRR